MPSTAPPEKATFNAAFRLFSALWAVRALLIVALFMPKNPAPMENSAPTRKQTDVFHPRPTSPMTTNISTIKSASTEYCRFK